jgi:23S rRNA pseudouridine2605 synthase
LHFAFFDSIIKKFRIHRKEPMQERLQKIIAAAGIASRRAAEGLIAEGRVRVNGKVVTEPGSKADPAKDHIKVDGKLINPHQPPTYIMLNKPAGYVTTLSDPEGRPTIQDLLKGVKTRVYPVGRLDYNTEGLLLLTNDGDFAHLITHPKHEFPKTYLAKVKGVLGEPEIEKLETGVFLDDGKTAPARVRKVSKEEMNSWLEITIHEGRKRQVRRMFDHVGHSVIKLKRIKTGSLVLGDLAEGSFRHLLPEEVNALRETALKVDEGGRQVRVFKPAVRTDKSREAGAGSVQIIDEDARKRARARIEMRDTRGSLRKNQGLRTPTARPTVAIEKSGGPVTRESIARRPGAGRPYRTHDRETSWPPKSAERRTGPVQKTARPDRAAGARTATGRPDWKTGAPRKPGFDSRHTGPGTGVQEKRPAPRKTRHDHFEGRREVESRFISRPARGPRAGGGTVRHGEEKFYGSREGFVRRDSRGEGAPRSGPRRPPQGRAGEKSSYGSREGSARRESRGEGAGYAPRRPGQKPTFGRQGTGRRTEGPGWKPSGARPNKSRFAGGKGPGTRSSPRRGPGGGSRGPRR